MSRQTAMSIFPLALVVILCLAAAPRLAWAENASGPAVASWTPDPEVTARLASDPGLLERQLDLAMRKVLKDPATLTITVTTRDPVARSRGFVDLISVREARGNVDNLVLERADIDFHDVQLDTTKLGGTNGLSFVLPVAMVVTKDNFQDAVTICADKPDAYLLDDILSEQEVLDTYFK